MVRHVGNHTLPIVTLGVVGGLSRERGPQLHPADSIWPLPSTQIFGWQNLLAMSTRACAEQKLAVEETILGEIAEGNYVITDVKPTIVSALGAIPKPDSSEVHLIHDCSRPVGQALNDYITSH